MIAGAEAGPRPFEVVVVAYHAEALLDRCLTALAASVPVTVVDNSSSTAVADVCARHAARYIDSGANLGFGGGVNIALREVLAGTPRDVLLLNPDAILAADGAVALSQRLHASAAARTAALSPRIVDVAGLEQRVAWPFPHPARAWLEALGLGSWNRSQDYLIGAVLLLRWEALQEVGLFDERFFLYAEEADWQRRASALGWHVAVVHDVTAGHLGAGTSTDPLLREVLFQAGAETYVRKWFGTGGWTAYRVALVLGGLVRGVLLPAERGAAARARARIVARGPRRLAGLT